MSEVGFDQSIFRLNVIMYVLTVGLLPSIGVNFCICRLLRGKVGPGGAKAIGDCVLNFSNLQTLQ